MKNHFEDVIKTWHNEPKEAAERLIDYYGEPDEFMESHLVWHNTKDGWKRTVLENVEIPHKFPAPHNDYLEQFIDYKVPADRFSDLAAYDGSVVVERTRGEMSARCGGTSMNFVAINLAHDVIVGNKTVDEARKEYETLYKAVQVDDMHPPPTQRFMFKVPHGGTQDPDIQTLKV